jgi:hypothetical protein
MYIVLSFFLSNERASALKQDKKNMQNIFAT